MGATLGTRLLMWLRGEPVSANEYGNRYYRLKNDKPKQRSPGKSRNRKSFLPVRELGKFRKALERGDR